MEKTLTYLSDTLAQKLALLLAAPMGVIIAPAGFGKTTAIRAALGAVPAKQQHWQPQKTGHGSLTFLNPRWFPGAVPGAVPPGRGRRGDGCRDAAQSSE